jgi:hypothetical protein
MQILSNCTIFKPEFLFASLRLQYTKLSIGFASSFFVLHLGEYPILHLMNMIYSKPRDNCPAAMYILY